MTKHAALILPLLFLVVAVAGIILALVTKNDIGGVFFVYHAHWPAALVTDRIFGWLKHFASIGNDAAFYSTSLIVGTAWYYLLGKLVLFVVSKLRSFGQ